MKIILDISKVERAIEKAKYQDPVYEPGRSQSSVKTFELDLPDEIIDLIRKSSCHSD